MNCPQCGLYLPDANIERCPRCGWVRAAAGGATPAPGYNPWANPGAPSAPAETPPQYLPPQGAPTAPGWPYYTQNATSPEGYPTPPQPAPDQASPYGQGFQQGVPPYGQPAQPSVPLYGQAAPPSVPMYGQYGQQYGQYAPPSVPMYGQASPPSMGQQPAWGSPFPPPPPQKKSNTGLIVTIVLVIVLLLGGGGGFLLLRGNAPSQTGNTGGSGTATVPAATATASNIVFQDSFNDPSTNWANDAHCSYGSGGYHIKDGYICFSPAGNFADATITTTVKQLSGDIREPYGISFRINDQAQTHYEFDIDSNGKWVVFKCGSGNCPTLRDYTANAAIHAGLNVTNTLTVAMRGSQFSFSVNGTKVGQITDSAYANGEVGLGAGNSIEVVYSSFQIANT